MLVTVFVPLRTTGAGETVFQKVVAKRFVVDFKMNPVSLVGQVRITFAPDSVIASGGTAVHPGAVTKKFLNATWTPGVIEAGQL